MKTYIDENDNTVKLYGQHKGFNGCTTTYARTHRGYAEIFVYKEGDKIGPYYGVQRVVPSRHILTIL